MSLEICFFRLVAVIHWPRESEAESEALENRSGVGAAAFAPEHRVAKFRRSVGSDYFVAEWLLRTFPSLLVGLSLSSGGLKR